MWTMRRCCTDRSSDTICRACHGHDCVVYIRCACACLLRVLCVLLSVLPSDIRLCAFPFIIPFSMITALQSCNRRPRIVRARTENLPSKQNVSSRIRIILANRSVVILWCFHFVVRSFVRRDSHTLPCASRILCGCRIWRVSVYVKLEDSVLSNDKYQNDGNGHKCHAFSSWCLFRKWHVHTITTVWDVVTLHCMHCRCVVVNKQKR